MSRDTGLDVTMLQAQAAVQSRAIDALAADVARQGEILQAVIVFMGQREMGSIYAGELLKELNAPSGNEDTSAL